MIVNHQHRITFVCSRQRAGKRERSGDLSPRLVPSRFPIAEDNLNLDTPTSLALNSGSDIFIHSIELDTRNASVTPPFCDLNPHNHYQDMGTLDADA